MPTINLYYKNKSDANRLEASVSVIKSYIAEQLICGDIKLTAEEVSIRFIATQGSAMIGSVELDITAHAFLERVKRQDEICRDIMDHVQRTCLIKDVRVWLRLCELGHSW